MLIATYCVVQCSMATLEWKFKEYLKQHGITPYRLQKEMGGQVSHRLTYDWARERPERLHLPVLERVMSALEGITGEPVDIKDFLEYVPEPEPVDDEAALLASSTSGLSQALHDLERDIPPEELDAWFSAFEQDRVTE